MKNEDNDVLVLNPVKIYKRMVLSATANEIIYKKYFGNCAFYQCKNAKYKWKLYQYSKYGLSRNQMKQYGKKNILNSIKNIVGETKIITFKKYAKIMNEENDIYFGNSVGYDRFKGNNLAIVGTYHINPLVYYMIYFCLDNKVCTEKPKNRLVSYDKYYTYNNVLMREIQIWIIGTELEQCIGRARLLREECNVFVFSDFPAEQAEFIEEDYLVL